MLEVHSDGSSHSRSGLPGGWAYVLVRVTDGKLKILTAKWDGDMSTSNQRMELKGALEGLLEAERQRFHSREPVYLISDSEYALHTANGRYNSSANLDLTNPLRDVGRRLAINWRHVRGHTLKKTDDWKKMHRDILLNNRCDIMAKYAKEQILAKSLGVT